MSEGAERRNELYPQFGSHLIIPDGITLTPVDITLNSNYIEGVVMHHQMQSQFSRSGDEVIFVNSSILPEDLRSKVQFVQHPSKSATLHAFHYFLQNPPQYKYGLRLEEVQSYYNSLILEESEANS